MEHTIGTTRVRVIQGDITTLAVDAIVNAANAQLAGGGGVDGAIHAKGGPSILEACKAYVAEKGPLSAGRSATTDAGDLPAKFVIHAVGPKYVDGQRGENVKLERAYRSALDEAKRVGARTVAFPSIATGAYRFPVDEAALIAMVVLCVAAKQEGDAFDEITMVTFSDSDRAEYEKAFDEVFRTHIG